MAAQFTFQSASSNINYGTLLNPVTNPVWVAYSESTIGLGFRDAMLPFLRVLQQVYPTSPGTSLLDLTVELRLLTGARVDLMANETPMTVNGPMAMKYLVPIEVKPPAVLPHTQVPLHALYAIHIVQYDAQHTFQPSPGCIFPIFQLMGYMVQSERRYGILTTYECTYFVERDPATPGVLRVSDPVF
ncbi:hypothetical protein HDU87_006964 [Geranomyces variabilis]|uniref:Uncharacterized protein n=1 Tax=Geranomyces variabilis TaxID=109894 RepID=A0AAD5TEP7_9FUNG|nr:hypothetical protein HDU87_006964 [Geranomyces variabilis]